MKPVHAWAALGLALLLGAAARAEVSEASATGFTVSHTLVLAAPPDQAWQALGQVGRWWSDAHTWSGLASNMSVDLQAGGCWCERWGEGNSVMHAQVVQVRPGKLLRLNAMLGPLQEMGAAGVLSFVISSAEGKTTLRVSYRVAGSPALALDKLAAPVDGVLGTQLQRLKGLVETGKAG